MRPLVFLACLMLCPLASAENEKLPELKLKNGKTYTIVTVTKKTADGIAIMHESGTARIPFEQLPDDLVKTLGGFDPEKAAAARKATAQSEEAHFAEMEKAANSEATKKIEAKTAKLIDEHAEPVIVEVIQALPDGALCKIAWTHERTDYRESKDSFGRTVRTPYKTPDTYRFSDANVFIRGLKSADRELFLIKITGGGEDKVYTTVLGARATVKTYQVVGQPKPAPTKPLPYRG